MQTLSNNDYKLFEQLVKSPENTLKNTMADFLHRHYKEVIHTQDYVYAIGNLPVMVVAHLDTVFAKPPEHIYYDQRKGVIWSPEGLGADDRAGILAIIKLIREGYRPTILLTTGEEIGGVGARAFVLENPIPPEGLKYVIQVDRRGKDDCVFYNCANDAFIEYISTFGFEENWGTFTDISTICPRWKIAGVNLSIGYFDEHTNSETFHVHYFLNTVEKIYKMLEDSSKLAEPFEYIYDTSIGYGGWFSKEWYCCTICGEPCLEHEIFPVKTSKGEIEYYCPECVVDHANWCKVCGEPFKIEYKGQNVCFNCLHGKEESGKCTVMTK